MIPFVIGVVVGAAILVGLLAASDALSHWRYRR